MTDTIKNGECSRRKKTTFKLIIKQQIELSYKPLSIGANNYVTFYLTLITNGFDYGIYSDLTYIFEIFRGIAFIILLK